MARVLGIPRIQTCSVKPNSETHSETLTTSEILKEQQKLSSRKPILNEVYQQQVHNDSSLSIDSSINSNIDFPIQIDLVNLVEFDDTQLNKIVIPLGYHPKSNTDITYLPVLCSSITNISNQTTSVYPTVSSVQHTDCDHDNNFSNNAIITNPQVFTDTPTRVLSWVQVSKVLNLSDLTITPPIQSLLDKSLSFAELDFGQIFSDFESHFRNLRLKHFFHRDPTVEAFTYSAPQLTSYLSSDSDSSLNTVSVR